MSGRSFFHRSCCLYTELRSATKNAFSESGSPSAPRWIAFMTPFLRWTSMWPRCNGGSPGIEISSS